MKDYLHHRKKALDLDLSGFDEEELIQISMYVTSRARQCEILMKHQQNEGYCDFLDQLAKLGKIPSDCKRFVTHLYWALNETEQKCTRTLANKIKDESIIPETVAV